jgi:hypothetical protein
MLLLYMIIYDGVGLQVQLHQYGSSSSCCGLDPVASRLIILTLDDKLVCRWVIYGLNSWLL